MHTVVCGLGYGDEGKGSVVDYLCSQGAVAAVIRFNGGAQAGHRVVLDNGRDHVFAQWGSGTLRGVPTFHSRYMAIDPVAMAAEAAHLISLGVLQPYSMLTIDPQCLVVTPYHKAWNRHQETERAAGRHGSCGMGHGAAVEHSLKHPEEVLRVWDIIDGTMSYKLEDQHRRYHTFMQDKGFTLKELQAYYKMWLDYVNIAEAGHLERLATAGDLVFEGAQGVLLDQWNGFHPYTTWSTTTFWNAEALLEEIGATATKLGVLRALSTRHGPGPFVSEQDQWLPLRYEHNTTSPWQGHFRLGHFDAVASYYACAVARPDAIALTHIDNGDPHTQYVSAYAERVDSEYIGKGITVGSRLPLLADVTDLEERTRTSEMLMRCTPLMAKSSKNWTDTVEDLLEIPVTLESWGPTAEDKRVRQTRGGKGGEPVPSTSSSQSD